MANPTADWEKVGDKFYRKIQLYTAVFDKDLELENYIVTGCSYGGAIGMLMLSTLRTMLGNARKSFVFGICFQGGQNVGSGHRTAPVGSSCQVMAPSGLGLEVRG